MEFNYTKADKFIEAAKINFVETERSKAKREEFANSPNQHFAKRWSQDREYAVYINGTYYATLDKTIEPGTKSTPKWTYMEEINGHRIRLRGGRETRKEALRMLVFDLVRIDAIALEG